MDDLTCGHTVVDSDGIEEPCAQSVTGWRYYEHCWHADMLARVCADHAQVALTEGIAEVRADERARVLAEFTEERRTDLPGRRGINPVKRLVGPWEPDTRTDEQRSDDATDELRARLGGDPCAD